MKVSYQPSSKSERPTVDKGLKVDYAAAKRGGFKGRWYLLLLLVISPVLIVLWVLARPHVFVLASGIVTTEPLEMRAPAKGELVSISVKQGQQLAKGNVVLEIVNVQLNAQINELNRQLLSIHKGKPQSNKTILQQLQLRIDVADEGVERQNDLLQTYKDFQKRGIVPTSDMAMILQAHTASKMALEQAKVDLLQEKERQHIESVAGSITQARHGIELQLANFRAQQADLVIHTPYDSHVADILVQQGEHIAEDQPLVLISGRSSSVIFAFLDPKYLDYTMMGQKATVKLPNGDHFRAQVSEPTELVGRLPRQLSGPFDGEKPVLRVTLTPDVELPISIEGVPVEVSFDYIW
ncbi:hypothetical protein GCM10007978_13780 [Shewanella hanedai]|jgi:multidrug resistance efflux pump|uniref:HlyD family secretion protein n=1 Tax=Shewanella hanedai TaxID=25 RepID=A0A553JQI0_SHEHA|nr:HlyD family efflux transporter periplasmic adaptor subunit [Shewanella hanedai]TRY14641.1 HlyD family secretion protein [Shewanella hanedai]GGI77355.1 hypothetical protein GCM10007978_13780 [Shewanella hanedai]